MFIMFTNKTVAVAFVTYPLCKHKALPVLIKHNYRKRSHNLIILRNAYFLCKCALVCRYLDNAFILHNDL